MKVLALLLSGLVLQTSASFFDDLRGAVSSVESGFGKLLTDVIYDVKETIDCTLMAVEQVLAVGVYSDASEYGRRCGGGTEVAAQPPQEPVVVATEPPPPVQEKHYESNPLTKMEHIQVDNSILNVDEVLCDVLKKDDTHAQLESIKLALKNETDRLNEISVLLNQQLEELSTEVKEKFKLIELQTSEPSVESIWNDIKVLHEIEHRHRNTDEAKKISSVLDKILSILDEDEEDRSAADDYKVQEIMHRLSRQTKGGDSDIWKDLENHPKDFRDYAKKIFDENRSNLPPDDITETPESEEQIVPKNAEKKDESVLENIENAEKKDENVPENTEKSHMDSHTEETTVVATIKSKRKRRKFKRTTTTTTERLLTIEELAAQYGSLFDVMPDIDSIENKKALDSAKNIIEDNKLNEAVIDSLAELENSSQARNLFENPDLLGEFNK